MLVPLGDDEGPDKFVAHAADGFGDGDVGLDGANLFGCAGAQRGHFARNDRCYRHQTSLTTFQKIVTNTWGSSAAMG